VTQSQTSSAVASLKAVCDQLNFYLEQFLCTTKEWVSAAENLVILQILKYYIDRLKPSGPFRGRRKVARRYARATYLKNVAFIVRFILYWVV
jgi:hypothetical protein